VNLENHNDTNGQESVERSVERREPEASRVSDREVPLRSPETSPAVQAWLDGEIPESAVRFGETAREVEFWKKLNVQVDQRRQMRTPPYVYEQIMAALPQAVPAESTSWWQRAIKVTPVTALAIGGALVAAGVVISLLVLRVL
jgi:hypothetical protein